MWVWKVNFNVLKVLNHPSAPLMKLHILLPCCSHQLSEEQTADPRCFPLIFPTLHLWICLLLFYNKLCVLLVYTSRVHVYWDWQVAEELQSGSMSTEEKELLNLLLSPHLKVNTFSISGDFVAVTHKLLFHSSPVVLGCFACTHIKLKIHFWCSSQALADVRLLCVLPDSWTSAL